MYILFICFVFICVCVYVLPICVYVFYLSAYVYSSNLRIYVPLVFMCACVHLFLNSLLECLLCPCASYYCATTQCSISGHYHFVVFFMLSTVYLFSKLHLASNPVSHESPGQITPNVVWTVIQLAPLCILFVSGSLVLYETYAGGYHSFRQIIYGITLALCSFSLYLLALRCS